MTNKTVQRLSTGIIGLDQILCGGLIQQRSYLIRGGPGTGKTTTGLHFLCEGVARNEKCLFITLVEPEVVIREDANRRGFAVDKIEFLDLSPTAKAIEEEQGYNIFSSNQVEQTPLIEEIIKKVTEYKPKRIFLDSITQLRFLSADAFQFRKQILSFVRMAAEQGATVFIASEGSVNVHDDDMQFISDGVINQEFSNDERFVRITKFRGSDFSKGSHSLKLSNKGITIFPKLRSKGHGQKYTRETISSGISELDEILNGGLERGTNTVLSGPSGVGKTTLGLQFMKEAASRGERSVIYTFEEGVETLIKRSANINIPIEQMISRGSISIVKVDPLEFSPDEFTHMVRMEVEEKNASIVMIDSLSGYTLSFKDMTDEDKLIKNLHSLNEYLKNMGVTIILINEMENITGGFKATDVGISYLADNIIFLRYLEMKGEIHKALGVLKKRLSDFEKSIRELEITECGIKIGKPLNNLQGVLSGNPHIIQNNDNGLNN